MPRPTSFCEHGFLGASMDEVAALAEVSKQTVYKQFASKEALFVGIVRSMTDHAGDRVQRDARSRERPMSSGRSCWPMPSGSWRS